MAMTLRHRVQRANQLILDLAQSLGASSTFPVLFQRALDFGARVFQRSAENLDGRRPESSVVRPRGSPRGVQVPIQAGAIDAAAGRVGALSPVPLGKGSVHAGP
jgi:hypothetical protein